MASDLKSDMGKTIAGSNPANSANCIQPNVKSIVSKADKIVRRVLPVYRATLDRWADKVLKEEEVSCRRGCHHCCYNLTKATLAEGALVASQLLEQGTFENYRAALDKTAGLADSVGEEDDASFRYLATKTPCAFLKDGECSIYEFRPGACRSYYVTSDPAQCSPDKPGAEVLYVDARGPMSAFISGVIHQTHPHIPMFIGPFPSVVLAGFELIQRSPGSFKRWSQKSKLFTENVEVLNTPM